MKCFAANQKCSTLKFGCIIVWITKDCYLYFQGNYIVNTFIILLASGKCEVKNFYPTQMFLKL